MSRAPGTTSSGNSSSQTRYVSVTGPLAAAAAARSRRSSGGTRAGGGGHSRPRSSSGVSGGAASSSSSSSSSWGRAPQRVLSSSQASASRIRGPGDIVHSRSSNVIVVNRGGEGVGQVGTAGGPRGGARVERRAGGGSSPSSSSAAAAATRVGWGGAGGAGAGTGAGTGGGGSGGGGGGGGGARARSPPIRSRGGYDIDAALAMEGSGGGGSGGSSGGRARSPPIRARGGYDIDAAMAAENSGGGQGGQRRRGSAAAIRASEASQALRVEHQERVAAHRQFARAPPVVSPASTVAAARRRGRERQYHYEHQQPINHRLVDPDDRPLPVPGRGGSRGGGAGIGTEGGGVSAYPYVFDPENESADEGLLDDDDEHDPWSVPPPNEIYEDEEGDDVYGDNWVVSSSRLDSEWESFWEDLHGYGGGGDGGGGGGRGVPRMGGGPGGAGVGDWGTGSLAADGWTYERLLELDEAVVKKGGMPVSKVRALPKVEFNPKRAAAEARAAAAEARARKTAATSEEEEEKEEKGKQGDEDEAAAAVAVDLSVNDDAHQGTTPPTPPPQYAGCAGEDCAVCLMDFIDGDEVTLLPPCGHIFHGACLLPWLKTHRHCPKCRAPLCQESECVARSGEGEDREDEDEDEDGMGSPIAGAAIAI